MFSLNQMNGKGFTPAALLLLSLSYVASVPCSLYDSTLTWREDPMSFEIPWRLDEVCQNSLECYGRSGYADHVQLCPVFIQQGDSINVTLPIASFYDLRPAIGESWFSGTIDLESYPDKVSHMRLGTPSF